MSIHLHLLLPIHLQLVVEVHLQLVVSIHLQLLLWIYLHLAVVLFTCISSCQFTYTCCCQFTCICCCCMGCSTQTQLSARSPDKLATFRYIRLAGFVRWLNSHTCWPLKAIWTNIERYFSKVICWMSDGQFDKLF